MRNWLRLRLLLQVVHDYRDRGLQVRIHPADSGVDLVVSGDGTSTLAVVKFASGRPATPGLELVFDSAQPQDVTLHWFPDEELIPQEAIDDWLKAAEDLLQSVPDMAMLMAYRASEAVLRRLATLLPTISSPSYQPGRMIADLREAEVLSEQEFLVLLGSQQTRNVLVHGLKRSPSPESLPTVALMGLCRRLCTTAEYAAVEYLDKLAASMPPEDLDGFPQLVRKVAGAELGPISETAATYVRQIFREAEPDQALHASLRDDPSDLDFLEFAPVADMMAEAIIADESQVLSSILVEGAWGSGKSTLLRLIERSLCVHASKSTGSVLVGHLDPWRDQDKDASWALVRVILDCLTEADESLKLSRQSRSSNRLLTHLSERLAIPRLITGGEDDLLHPNLNFSMHDRYELSRVLSLEDFASVGRLVIIIDDLDRCPPHTLLSVLNSIRSLQESPKLCFVVAADVESLVHTATAVTSAPIADSPMSLESAVSQYLERCVRARITVPKLAATFDTEAYLVLLQLSQRFEEPQLQKYVSGAAKLRDSEGQIEDLTSIVEGDDVATEIATAKLLAPILLSLGQANPRHIKRFLNELGVWLSIANQRGVHIDRLALAKLLALKSRSDDYRMIQRWAQGNLWRSRLSSLEDDGASFAQSRPGSEAEQEADHSNALITWAQATPLLSQIDPEPYISLLESSGDG